MSSRVHIYRQQARARRCKGFTLIELMIAVAIIGILAATAITAYRFFVMRSKRTEAVSNLATISKMQLGFFHEGGAFEASVVSPALGVPSDQKQVWSALRPSFSSIAGDGFDVIGFEPEGAVYFDYDTEADDLGGAGWRFTAAAYGDVDADGNLSAFLYVYPDGAGVSLPSGIGGFTVPWHPTTCQPHYQTTAQVLSDPGCGFPAADDF